MRLKQPTTFEDQVQLLREKNIFVDDTNSCIGFVNKANYYCLSAYYMYLKYYCRKYIHNIPFNQIQRYMSLIKNYVNSS